MASCLVAGVSCSGWIHLLLVWKRLLAKAECREGLPKAFWGKKHLMMSKTRKPNGTCLGPA